MTTVPTVIDFVTNGRLEQILRSNDVVLDKCDPESHPFTILLSPMKFFIDEDCFLSKDGTFSCLKMALGNRVILDSLLGKCAPGIEVAESVIELS